MSKFVFVTGGVEDGMAVQPNCAYIIPPRAGYQSRR